jgi:predicted 3-demethylubiquinone-9 3-methyltransferase (glyoxalase superfamily)
MSNQLSLYPCLWFNNQAKEAALFYCSIFKRSSIIQQNELAVTFFLNDTKFIALNQNNKHPFTPATSFVIECETQEEIDHYWEKLGKGGKYSQCGWLTDKFGISWQIVTTILPQLMKDSTKAPAVTKAFLQMQKFDIQTLLDAANKY